VTPPPFYKSYLITTIPESNDSGDWFGYRIVQHNLTLELKGGKSIWEAAKSFRKLVTEGKVKVATEEREEVVHGNASDDSI
jgi:hypothetical protein